MTLLWILIGLLLWSWASRFDGFRGSTEFRNKTMTDYGVSNDSTFDNDALLEECDTRCQGDMRKQGAQLLRGMYRLPLDSSLQTFMVPNVFQTTYATDGETPHLQPLFKDIRELARGTYRTYEDKRVISEPVLRSFT